MGFLFLCLFFHFYTFVSFLSSFITKLHIQSKRLVGIVNLLHSKAGWLAGKQAGNRPEINWLYLRSNILEQLSCFLLFYEQGAKKDEDYGKTMVEENYTYTKHSKKKKPKNKLLKQDDRKFVFFIYKNSLQRFLKGRIKFKFFFQVCVKNEIPFCTYISDLLNFGSTFANNTSGQTLMNQHADIDFIVSLWAERIYIYIFFYFFIKLKGKRKLISIL